MQNNRLEVLADDFLAQHHTDILKREQKIDVDIYFDNSDIRAMILGLRSFEYHIDRDKLNSPQTLVQSLAYFGWIRNIKVLPPHQDELVDYLSKKHLLPIYSDRRADESTINELLGSVGLLDINKLQEYATEGKIRKYLEGFKSKSVELFKVNYLLKDFHWNERLKKVISFDENAIVTIDESSYDLTGAIKTRLFADLLAVFQGDRKDRSKNNFRDALALTLMKSKIADFLHKPGTNFPIFYASTHIIKKLRENKLLYVQFDVPVTVNGEEKIVNILRDSYYFILDVLFNLLTDNEVPSELFKRIQAFRRRFSGLSFELLSSSTSLEKELDGILFRDRFFDEFWFKKIEPANISSYISDLVSLDFLITNKEVRTQMERDRRNTTERLEAKLDKFRLIELIWEKIEEFPYDMGELFTRRGPVNVFTELGMARFSLEDYTQIQDIVDTLFDKGFTRANEDFHNLKVQLTIYIINGVYEKKYDELLVGISIFWIFNKHEEICQILALLNYDYGDYYQLALLHAASIYPSEHLDKSILGKILGLIEAKETDAESYRIWIGMCFVYYQAWKLKSRHGRIPEETSEPHDPVYDPYMDKAITLAQGAYEWLKKNKDTEKIRSRNLMYYYTLNNLLYFKIRREENSKSHIAAWGRLAAELAECKDMFKGLYWQTRFDHTLALYEYRMAVIKFQMGIVQEVLHHLAIAKKYIDETITKVVVKKYDYDSLRDAIHEMLITIPGGAAFL